MGRPYSVDLRERVVAAVEKGAVVPSSGGAIWRLRQHVHSLDAALPQDRQGQAGPDRWQKAYVLMSPPYESTLY